MPKETKAALSETTWDEVEVDVKYAGYIKRQEQTIVRSRNVENRHLPDSIDYSEVRGLKTEAQHRLSKIRPATLGQASRISGLTPADIALLAVWLAKGNGDGKA